MFLTAALLILAGIVCLAGIIVCLIFTVVGFANKRNNRYGWLAGLFISIFALIFCVYTFVTKAVNKVEELGNEFKDTIEDSFQNLSDSMMMRNAQLMSNAQIQHLKQLYPDSSAVPDQFYYYLGFDTYYRLPLRYPYAIHCYHFKDNGDLYNEQQVSRFDVNDNGEQFMDIDRINRIAFDSTCLLIDQKVPVKDTYTHHYKLLVFNNGKTEDISSEKELFKAAKRLGYKGPDTLMTLQSYSLLFEE